MFETKLVVSGKQKVNKGQSFLIASFKCSIICFGCAPTGKNKAKKAKHSSAVEPIEEGEDMTDTTGKKWKLMKLLSQSTTEVIYEGETVSDTSLKVVEGIKEIQLILISFCAYW